MAAQPGDDLQWQRLSDFTPGIYDYNPIPNNTAVVPAPLGSADASATYNCIALPDGGLGPLPGLTDWETFGHPLRTYAWEGDLPADGTPLYLTGQLVHVLQGYTEAFVVAERIDGTNSYIQVVSYDIQAATSTDIIPPTTTAYTGSTMFGSPYPYITRAALSAPTTTPGQPVIVWPFGDNEFGSSVGNLFLYPNPNTPTSYTSPLDLVATNPGTAAGYSFVHQSRIVNAVGVSYDWPGSSFSVNEQICFTDPPNSTTYGAQNEVFVAEEPYGYGAWGSISAGELFMAKQRGGGLIVSGDIFSPTTTYFPGVMPTGDAVGRAASGVSGLFYCSVDNGAWVWNGGNSSSKISKQLRDNFYQTPDSATIPNGNYNFNCEFVGDKAYFSNNWMFDTRTGGWWRYYPTAEMVSSGQSVFGADLWWYSYTGNGIAYASPLSITPAVSDPNPAFLYGFDQNSPTGYWQWRSTPMKLSENHYINVREVVVRVSNPYGNDNSQIIVEVLNNGGDTSFPLTDNVVGSVTTPSGDIGPVPTSIRIPIGPASGSASGVPYATSNLTVNIFAQGNDGPAPIVHYIDFGYKERQHIKTTGVAS